MSPDRYMKMLLTIIAVCLVALTFRRGSIIPAARAASSTTCTGELNAFGEARAIIGGYKIELSCDEA